MDMDKRRTDFLRDFREIRFEEISRTESEKIFSTAPQAGYRKQRGTQMVYFIENSGNLIICF